ncbi:putative sugar transferase [Clostridiaceae bacterium JG1575]|nr:putative sugar transferase [Clostridiaceae bacterium JG1575]
MLLSIITPAYNEEASIEKLWTRVRDALEPHGRAHGYDFELIFINDGSHDRTLAQIRRMAKTDLRIKYISFSRNFGKESAMLAGLTYCRGDYAVIMDSDLQHPADLLPKMMDAAQKGYDQVMAKRTRTGDAKGRTFFSRLYYRLVNNLMDVHLEDGVGDFRLLSRKAVDSLLAMKESTRFSKGLFAWIGFDGITIPYENVAREEGTTKWSFRALLKYAVDGIMSFNDKPLRISFYTGLFTMLLGLIYIIYSLVRVLVVGIEAPGYFTMISAVLLVGGIQLISVGILGEYIGKIYYEVKGRPHFLVSETNLPHLRMPCGKDDNAS